MILRGDLLAALPAASMDEVADTYEQAVRFAEERRLRMPHLRGATRLARLRRATRAEASARDALASVYGSFTEGFDTPDLVAARTVLDTG
jgi:hypothetical protein